MEYKKYASIENHYREEYIEDKIQRHPEYLEDDFILTEKIDGSNIQLIFNPHQALILGKRTDIIHPGEKFFNILNVIKQYEPEIAIIQKYVDEKGEPLRIYGEIFGKGVIERINYGDAKYIRFFDAMVPKIPSDEIRNASQVEEDFEEIMDEEFLTQKDFMNLLQTLDIYHMFVPVVTRIKGLKHALDYDLAGIKSVFLPELAQPVEGLVIKHYDKVVRDWAGSMFYLKKKNQKFLEKAQKKVKKPIVDSSEVVTFKEQFLTYLNENRLLGIISKNGPIQSMKDMGKYIGLLVKDAREDFEKDFKEVLGLDKTEQKRIYKTDKAVIDLIKKHVEN